MLIEVNHFFDAAHQLEDSQDLVTKACHNLHGHTYHVNVKAFGPNINHGMVVDFKKIKQIIDRFDHTTILQDNDFGNEVMLVVKRYVPSQKVILLDNKPTAENIGLKIREDIFKEIPHLTEITITITEGFKGADKSSSVTII